MRISPAVLRIILSALAAGAILLAAPGCSKDGTIVDPGPVVPTDSIPYGGGSVSFTSALAGGSFSASGPYKPSALFAADTMSQGSGGMLHDSVAAGTPYQARLNAYIHRLSGGLMSERVFVITLENAGGPLDTGAYAATVADTAAPGRSARITYLFFSDSLAQYAAYEGTAGTVSVTHFDAATRRIKGTFSLALRSAPPDTTEHIAITDGAFDLTLAKKYYDY